VTINSIFECRITYFGQNLQDLLRGNQNDLSRSEWNYENNLLEVETSNSHDESKSELLLQVS